MSARLIEFPEQGLPGTLVRYTEGGGEPVEVEPRGAVALSSGSRLVYVIDAADAEAADKEALADGLAGLPSDAFVVADLGGATDGMLRAVAGQRAVRTLVLSGDFTDEGVAALGTMPELTDLVLESPRFTGTGLAALAGSETAGSLDTLVLSGTTAFEPRSLAALAEAPHLASLAFEGLPVDHALADALIALTPHLAEVSVAERPGHDLALDVLERLLAAGLSVNGIAAPPENAALFARAAAEAADTGAFEDEDAEDFEDGEGEEDEEPQERGVLREITDEAELDRLLAGPVPVLVHLTAPWCGPCSLLTPVLEDVVEACGDALTGVKIDVDRAGWAQERFDAMGVPTVILVRAGKESFRFSGVASAAQLTGWLAAVGVAAG
ncbi:thioredoxin family protein [Streptomyces telluris]|uniref:Thioredoxin family protein n=1 Tax=Streptomyces telluris TaxID=2720021 RepID=A0A9X2LEB5_9ACTN|nr:thioredoxin family protein [Streptomyces telluris]MCQ8768455.1 thioredoxin family protein [Streptomyces telluris]NJP81990.1 thioredoxin family protein [Streptomyces telluris]